MERSTLGIKRKDKISNTNTYKIKNKNEKHKLCYTKSKVEICWAYGSTKEGQIGEKVEEWTPYK